MKLILSIQSSFIKQGNLMLNQISDSYFTDRNYINDSLRWDDTKEGYLFWYILHYSYYLYGTYDYDTIIKLYNLYGDEVFKLKIHPDYNDYDSEKNTLTTEEFEYLCKRIERNGIVRKHS